LETPLEHEEQKDFCKWLRRNGIEHVGIPNAQALSGLHRRVAIKNMLKLKLEGFQPGFPDMLVFLKHIMLVIEMKRIKGGKVSGEQKEWLDFFKSLPYSNSYVARGHEEAIKIVKKNLDNKQRRM